VGRRAETRARSLDRRARRLHGRAQRLDNLGRRYASIRLVIFFGGLVAAVVAWQAIGGGAGLAVGAAALLAFAGVAAAHNRVELGLRRYTLLARLASAQLARLTLDWPRLPAERARPAPPDHPFAADLDLVGDLSLHRLIDTAVSREGSERLRDWLLATDPDHERARRRQGLVRALAPRVRARDKLLLTATLATGGSWSGEGLARWLDARPPAPLARGRALALSIGALLVNLLVVASALASAGGPALQALAPLRNPRLLGAALTLAGALFLLRRRLTAPYLVGVAGLDTALEVPRRVFAYLETEPFGASPELRALYTPFLVDRGGTGTATAGKRPSELLARVGRVAALASLRGALAWPLVNAALPLDLYVAYRLGHDRTRLEGEAPRWLDIWYELEALSSLANLAYLRPDYAFPELHESDAGDTPSDRPVFAARGLGHPLIPEGSKVVNNFTLRRLGDVGLITGSNMAGKSSFLRALGVNLRLADAGGPVDAAALRTGAFRVFTSIAVGDSITAGYSYFYAEVRRLKALLTALEQGAGQNEGQNDGEGAAPSAPLFFLVDEIFRGTNNRERLLGGQAYLRAITGRHGVGVVSTHDLGLVELADVLPQITNYHFRDAVVDGRLVFDYILRPGPVPTTNALAIMRLAGLPVPPEEPLHG